MSEKKKIKVAFPHMGTIYVVWATALKRLGVEPYVPPYTTKKPSLWVQNTAPSRFVFLTSSF